MASRCVEVNFSKKSLKRAPILSPIDIFQQKNAKTDTGMLYTLDSTVTHKKVYRRYTCPKTAHVYMAHNAAICLPVSLHTRFLKGKEPQAPSKFSSAK